MSVSGLKVHQRWFSDNFQTKTQTISPEAVKRKYLWVKMGGAPAACAAACGFRSLVNYVSNVRLPAKPKHVWVLRHCLHVGSYIHVSGTYTCIAITCLVQRLAIEALKLHAWSIIGHSIRVEPWLEVPIRRFTSSDHRHPTSTIWPFNHITFKYTQWMSSIQFLFGLELF